jgi:LemA protein
LETLLFIIVCFMSWAAFSYNRLVRDRNRVLSSWSDIDVQLKRRHDLIPKLVDAVKQYADYEVATLEAVTKLRNADNSASLTQDRVNLESRLGNEVHRLIALAESYPDLKANQSFLDLQQNISDVEKYLQHARRYYNGCVRNLNIRVVDFPGFARHRIALKSNSMRGVYERQTIYRRI